MNREIKFRAMYDHMGGGWKYGMLIYEGEVPRIQVDGTMTFATCLKGTEGQYTGLKDKSGKEIYEGDVVRWCKLEIEWQTHTGDNIPCGSYTEPCGIISKWETAVVKFIDGEFTILDNDEDSEYTYNWLRHDHLMERKDINYIFFPHYDESRSQQYKDEDFIETMNDVAKELDISPASIDEFISMINGVKVIGNIYQNHELITP